MICKYNMRLKWLGMYIIISWPIQYHNPSSLTRVIACFVWLSASENSYRFGFIYVDCISTSITFGRTSTTPSRVFLASVPVPVCTGNTAAVLGQPNAYLGKLWIKSIHTQVDKFKTKNNWWSQGHKYTNTWHAALFVFLVVSFVGFRDRRREQISRVLILLGTCFFSCRSGWKTESHYND